MKTIKILQTGLVIIVLSILIGCSDQLMNPELSTNNNSSNSYSELSTVNSALISLETQLDLKPNGSYTFDNSNTKFAKIKSIDAEIITVSLPAYIDCNNLFIYSKSSALDVLINCKSNGLDLKDITIENTSDEAISLSVKLTGVLRIEKPVKYN